jgi:bla regulator protein BlaR1
MNLLEILTRLFTLVAEASIAATILTLIVFAIERGLQKRLSAAWRFAIYLPVLLRLLLPIVPESPTSILNVPTWIKPVDKPKVSFSPTALPTQLPATILVAENASLKNPVLRTNETLPQKGLSDMKPVQFFAMLWFAVAVILLLRLGIGALRLNRRLARERAASPELLDLIETLRLESGTRRKLRVIETPLVESPCLFGLLRAKLLLPVGFAERLTKTELSHVMLHELAHLKRGDLVINGIMAVARAAHWFNPVVWLLFRRMRLLRELACDRLVLEMRRADSADARAYGETLLKLINSFSSRAITAPTIGILENEQSVEARLHQIAIFVPHPRRISATGILVIGVLLAVGLSNAQSPRIESPPAEIEAAPTSTAKSSAQELKAKRSAANIETLEREYVRAKQEVDQARAEVDRLVKELGIVIQSKEEQAAGLTDGSIQNPEYDAAGIQQKIQKSKEQLNDVTALLDQLKKLPREELRKALPTSLQPPDETLNRLLGDYSTAEQKHAQLSGNFSKGHPDVATAREVLAVIDRQIEHRIDGILMGLEVRKSTGETILKSLYDANAAARAEEAERRERYMPFFKAKRSLDHSQRVLDTIFMRLLAEKVDAKVPVANETEPAFE